MKFTSLNQAPACQSIKKVLKTTTETASILSYFELNVLEESGLHIQLYVDGTQRWVERGFSRTWMLGKKLWRKRGGQIAAGAHH